MGRSRYRRPLAIAIQDRTNTRYFCVPYPIVADEPVTYSGLYEAFADVTLPSRADQPIAIEVAGLRPDAVALDVDDTVKATAALMLTGEPIAVVGAESVPLRERLRFLDAVACLLPFGFRTRFTASTWALISARDQIKLFFARNSLAGVTTVVWKELPPPPVAELARLYREGLTEARDMPRLIEQLSTETTERSADRPEELLKLLDSRVTLPITGLLTRLATALGNEDLELAGDCLGQLTARITVSSTPAGRAEFRRAIRHLRLLTQPFGIPSGLERRMYVAVLSLAYGRPIAAGSGALILADLAATSPSPALIDAIWQVASDPADRLIIAGRASPAHRGSLLREFPTDDLIRTVAQTALDPTAVRSAIEELIQRTGESRSLRTALSAHNYLTDAIQILRPGQADRQFAAFRALLVAAYGDALDAPTATSLISTFPESPLPFLAAALDLADESACTALINRWLVCQLESDGLSPELLTQIQNRLYTRSSPTAGPRRFPRAEGPSVFRTAS